MMLDLADLTNLLEIDDPIITRFQSQVLHNKNNKGELDRILAELCPPTGKKNCPSCESKGTCSFVMGVAHYYKDDIKTSIMDLDRARLSFYMSDDIWNSIVCLAALGLVHKKNNNLRQSIHHIKDSIFRLETNYLGLYAYDRPPKGMKLQKDLQELRIDLSAPRQKKRVSQRASLVFASLPVLRGVQAGPNGPVWEHLPKSPKTSVDQVLLEDQLHTLYSIIRNSQIALNTEKNYAWAKVAGDSMSASQPTNILENDHVLFFESTDADNGDIVVASIPDQSGSGYQFTVKRLSKVDRLLISETDPPNKYAPIPLDKNTRILGVVIAVAKPIDE